MYVCTYKRLQKLYIVKVIYFLHEPFKEVERGRGKKTKDQLTELL